jgi:hypothetical protein
MPSPGVVEPARLRGGCRAPALLSRLVQASLITAITIEAIRQATKTIIM